MVTALLWSDENVLELDHGGGRMALNVLNSTKLCCLKRPNFCCVNFTSTGKQRSSAYVFKTYN